jgi:hypothetical protein
MAKNKEESKIVMVTSRAYLPRPTKIIINRNLKINTLTSFVLPLADTMLGSPPSPPDAINHPCHPSPILSSLIRRQIALHCILRPPPLVVSSPARLTRSQ